MKKNSYLIVAFIVIIGYNACENDDFLYLEEEDNMGALIPEGENNNVLAHDSIRKIMITQELLSTLCHVDTINDSTFTYRPKYGTQDEANPSTFLFKSIGDKDALSFFMHLISHNERDKIMEGENTLSYSVDEKLTIKYTYIGSSEMIAMIEFDILEIPEIKRYVYLPAELWPYNDSNSPFSLGSVWQRIDENQTKTKYVCVKEYCGKNDPGILMTFERGWKEHSAGSWNNSQALPYNCAGNWAWLKLQDLYCDYRMMFDDAVKEGAIPSGITSGKEYVVGSPSYRTWTTGWWFWKEEHHEGSMEWVQFVTGDFQFNTTRWRCCSKQYGKTLTGNRLGSSQIEFNNTMPAGEWEQISF